MSFQHVASIDPSYPLELQAQRWLTAPGAHRKSHREKAARLHPEPGAVTP